MVLLLEFCWLLVQLVAYFGFGSAVRWCLNVRNPSTRPRAHVGGTIALGVCAFAVIGGILNLLGRADRLSLILLFTVSALATVIDLFRRNGIGESIRRFRLLFRTPIQRAAAGLLIVTLLFRLSGSIYSTHLNKYDDLQGYLAFVTKMLHTGSLGREFFSERRAISGLGGMYALIGVSMAPFSIETAVAADRGLGLVILVFLTLGWTKDVWPQLALATAVALCPFPAYNTSACVLAAALLVALMVNVTVYARRPTWSTLLQGVILGAGIGSLKATYLFPAAAMVGMMPFFGGSARDLFWSRSWPRAVVAGIVFVGLLSPWMICQYRDTLTPLYPLLGKGVHQSAYGNLPSPAAGPWTAAVVFGVAKPLLLMTPLVLFAGVVLACFLANSVQRGPLIGISSACLIAVTLITVNTGGSNIARYAFPLFFAPVVWIAVLLVRKGGLTARYGGFSLAILLLVFSFRKSRLYAEASQSWSNLLAGVDGAHATDPDDRASVRDAQRCVPVGATILTRLTNSTTLDFRRNPIQTADWPGSASPRPGMPLNSDPQTLRRYLLHIGIRYVMYSYANEAGYPRREFGDPANIKDVWIRNETSAALWFQDSISQLADQVRVLYRDSRTFVLDLDTLEPKAGSGKANLQPPGAPGSAIF